VDLYVLFTCIYYFHWQDQGNHQRLQEYLHPHCDGYSGGRQRPGAGQKGQGKAETSSDSEEFSNTPGNNILPFCQSIFIASFIFLWMFVLLFVA
jgi:hypothetical protein